MVQCLWLSEHQDNVYQRLISKFQCNTSEYLHFEDWQGNDVCLCHWKSHMKNTKCRVAPDLVYEK